jgi:hypothetical protein
MYTVRLTTLLGRGVPLLPHEAVAIAQLLMHARGIATPENVEVSSDGNVTCPEGTPPQVADMAALLLCLLGPRSRAPGGLRYAVARALGDVDAPPFRSVEEFSSALNRFEEGDRTDVVRRLLQRIVAERPWPIAISGDPATTSSPPEDKPFASEALISPPSFASVDRQQTLASPAWRPLAVIAALVVSGLAGFLVVADGHRTTASKPAPVSQRPESTGSVGSATPERPAATAGRNAPSIAEPTVVASSSAYTEANPEPPAPTPVESNGPIPALPDRAGQAFSPAFSPDGSALFFHTGGRHDATSALAEVSSSTARPADPHGMTILLDDGARNYHVHPSPDGRFIAYDSDREGERAVFVADRDGSNIRRVSGEGYAAVPTWAPDGRSLAYVRAEPGHRAVWNLWIKRDGEPEQRLTHFRFGQTWGAAWFPDGRRIAVSHEHDLLVLDLTTGRSRRFASPVEGALVRTPAVSPDGSRIVFQVSNHGVWTVNLADGSMQCVLHDRTAEEFAWSPDGTRVAFHRKWNGRWGIYELVGLSGHRDGSAQ